MKKVLFITSIIFFTITQFSCSKAYDISGIYVHSKGLLKYYTMTVTKKEGSRYMIKFEGVPLNNYNKTEWSKICNGIFDGKSIKCDGLILEFFTSVGIVDVSYSENEKQIFINNKKEIDEEITLYNKVQKQSGKEK